MKLSFFNEREHFIIIKMIRPLLLSLLTTFEIATSCATVAPCNLYRPVGGGVVSVKDAVICTCAPVIDCATLHYTYTGTGLVPWLVSNG